MSTLATPVACSLRQEVRNVRQPTQNIRDDQWIAALEGEGEEREPALAQLHALLLRAARFEVARRRAALPPHDVRDLDDLALQSADDALVAVHDVAYKFAVLEAAVKLRRRPWEGREIALDAAHWPDPPDARDGPELSCDECFEHVDRYVDAELRDGEAAADRAIPGMRAHLAGCQACAEEHTTLLALAGED